MNKIKSTKMDLGQFADLQKNIMNEKRLQILITLEQEHKSWSQLMLELDLRNPKLLHDHVSLLLSANLISKDDDGYYKITKTGTVILKGNLALMHKMNSTTK